ncbi:MAG: hypothetical protein HFI34_07345 [Lachnospiraceae bacterium]|nr:hypothetical protein [Lachnospiraceae bacterium]
MDNSNRNDTENHTVSENLTKNRPEQEMQMEHTSGNGISLEKQSSNPVQIEKNTEQTRGTAELPVDEVAFMAGGADKLREILKALDERDRYKADMNSLVADGKKVDGEIKQLRSKLESDINTAIKNAMIETVAPEDKILAEENAKLKEVRQQREKAKNKGIRDRIEYETRDLSEENREYKRSVKRGLKENGLPAFCDSNAFFIMYCSQTAVEWVIRLAVFFTAFFVFPAAVLLIADPWWLWKLIWWVVIDVIMLAIYMTIYLISKDRDAGILDEVREIRDKIAENEKKIRKISSDIKKDPDESSYNLGEYDDEIKNIEAAIEEASLKKNGKLKEFEEFTKQTIIDTMNSERMPEINEKQQILEEKTDIYNQLNQKFTEINQTIEEKYEKYLTKQFSNRQKIQRMIELIETGQAVNIGQAKELLIR